VALGSQYVILCVCLIYVGLCASIEALYSHILPYVWNQKSIVVMNMSRIWMIMLAILSFMCNEFLAEDSRVASYK
jgi:hypothetical protein